MSEWRIYQGKGDPHKVEQFPEAPPWRTFSGKVPEGASSSQKSEDEQDPYAKRMLARGEVFQIDEKDVDLVNTALYLRRPLLVSGPPGCGKSSLPYAVARELMLGPVLRWSITSSTRLSDGLYHYDAVGRIQDNASLDIGDYIRLGPLGAALYPSDQPCVLLIDEIDKSDIDLPNDLLHVFEEGEFEIPELVRYSKANIKAMVEVFYGAHSLEKVGIINGRVCCREFPFVVMTSNGEREFPPAFLRRCIRLDMKIPTDKDKLTAIVKAHLKEKGTEAALQLIDDFLATREKGSLATDQLLNAAYFVSRGIDLRDKETVLKALWEPLSKL